jgi:hypothetical protein
MPGDETKAISWLPRISMGLTLAQLSERLPCAELRRSTARGQARGDWKTHWASRLGVEAKSTELHPLRARLGATPDGLLEGVIA